jgi:hypothetical protein
MPMTGRKALNGATLYARCLRGVVRAGALALAALLPVLSRAAAEEPASPHFFGFTPQQSLSERALEQRFDADIDPGQLREWLRSLSAEANHVGSPHNKANAERVRDLFKQWGWDAQIETFEVLYPTLRDHALELVGPTRFVARVMRLPLAKTACPRTMSMEGTAMSPEISSTSTTGCRMTTRSSRAGKSTSGERLSLHATSAVGGD